jgi:hypothetical protein
MDFLIFEMGHIFISPYHNPFFGEFQLFFGLNMYVKKFLK